MNNSASPAAVAVPILVGITGKRRIRLDELGVSQCTVRTKLHRAFRLLQESAPNSPKLLLCGMADGVDEIAARLVIEAVDEHDPDQREFENWSVVGLLPMPEEAFLDDFAPGPWWYRTLPAKQRRLIRLMPLRILAKPSQGAAQSCYTVADLRRRPGGSNAARTEHYEQLGLVLAERSTVLVAVMQEDEEPQRLGGTAQVVAHRLNGWRRDWPSPRVRDIAARSSEIVVPAPLATPVAGDVWLIPIRKPGGAADPVDLRVLRSRQESEPAWPKPPETREPEGRRARADHEILIGHGRCDPRRARSSSPLLRPLDDFNCRARHTNPRPPPDWDRTIAANPDSPGRWSPLAAAERLRGIFSDIQRDRKRRVGNTATWLAVIAGLSIFLLELYAELVEKWKEPLQIVTFAYVGLVVAAMWLYYRAVKRRWPAVAEDYRLIAEALRVQIVWWRFGLTARRDRVDNVVLRYDTGALQLLRRGLATVLDGLQFLHDEIPPAPVDRLPDAVIRWIDSVDRRSLGQIQYHGRTAEDRKRRYGKDEFLAWSLFGMSLGAAVWLAVYTLLHMLHLVEAVRDWLADARFSWLIPVIAGALAGLLLRVLRNDDIRSPELAFMGRRIFGSWLAGILLGAGLVAVWAMLWAAFRLDPDWDGLRRTFFLASVVPLAVGGIIRYRTEKLAIEAEAQGSEMALPIYCRAREALDQIEDEIKRGNLAPDEARRRRERVIRDLGEFALAETEAWLRSHRERPLHPALG